MATRDPYFPNKPDPSIANTQYGMSVAEICLQALKKLNVVAVGQSELGDDYLGAASDALYLVAKECENDGLHQWRQRQGALKLVPGQAEYEFAGEFSTIVDDNDEVITHTPLRMLSIRARQGENGYTRLIYLGSREDYYRLSNRQTQGHVVQAFYDRTIFDKKLILWPVPDNTEQFLEYTYEEPFVDTRDAYYGDEIYFPDRWTMYLIYAVAHYLAPDFSREDKVAYLERQMDVYKSRALNFDEEDGGVQFSVRMK